MTDSSFWRGLVAVSTTLTYAVGLTAGLLTGRIDGTLYIAGMASLVTGVSTFYFAHELRNGLQKYDKLVADVAFMERAKMRFDRAIGKKTNV